MLDAHSPPGDPGARRLIKESPFEKMFLIKEEIEQSFCRSLFFTF